MMNRHFSDLLSEFNAARVEYLVVDAFAVAAHGHPRATKDLDIWVRAEPANAARVMSALQAFGAPLADVRVEDFSTPGVFLQLGVPPMRIDILTALEGVSFEDAWPRRVSVPFGAVDAAVIGREDLIRCKRAAGRHQDLADLENLG